MKKNKMTATNPAAIMSKFTGVMVTILLTVFGSLCQAQPSPVGTWDFVITGAENGTAFLYINDDFTLSGTKIVVGRQSSPDDLIVFNRSATGTRDDEATPDDAGPTEVRFGSYRLEGTWSFDARGRIIGFYTETAEDLAGVSTVRPTSFRGTVREGRSLTLQASVPNGRTVLKGVPSVDLPDLSEFSWNAIGKKDGILLVESFTLTPTGDPNSYFLDGSGPGYRLEGEVLVSAQRKISIVVGVLQESEEEGETLVAIRAVTGSFNLSRLSGSTKGVDSDDAKIRYTIFKQ